MDTIAVIASPAEEKAIANDMKAQEECVDLDNTPDTEAQPGVQSIEAVTVVWSKSALIAAYGMIWVIFFVEGMVSSVSGALQPYVTSAFANHSLTPTVAVLSSVIGGVTNLTLAKVLDIFGRPQGLLLCTTIAVIGVIMVAACHSVEAYAAAEVFFVVGNNGIQYTLNIFVADTSRLRNRGFMEAFAGSPNLITCWIAGPMASAFLARPGWRWGFGTWSVVLPVVILPLFLLFAYNSRKAVKQGMVPRQRSERTMWQSIHHYVLEFDAVGILLLSAGVALFLLPFNIYPFQPQGWASPLVICLLIFGFVLLIAFALWERFLAPVSFIPVSLLLDRTVFGAGLLGATLFVTYSSWISYFSSFLQVVGELSVSNATNVVQAWTVVNVLSNLSTGLWLRWYGHPKYITLFFGIPISILGTGLMIYFRQPGVNIGYIVMCQILAGWGSGVIVITVIIAALSAASHQQIAVVIALLSIFSSIGGAIGLTVSAAIWQSVLPASLAAYLAESEQANLLTIFEDLNTQLSYPPGSPTRIAIQHAYGDAQKMLMTAATAFWAVGIIGALMWRDINIKNVKQVKGQVF